MTEKLDTSQKIDALKHLFSSRGWRDVLRPALVAAIGSAQAEWLTGKRNTGNETVSDEGLKQRIIALRWLVEQERSANTLIQQLEQIEEMQKATVPAIEGGSPYA